ncbi:hypothetical protein [Nostocoides australiense]
MHDIVAHSLSARGRGTGDGGIRCLVAVVGSNPVLGQPFAGPRTLGGAGRPPHVHCRPRHPGCALRAGEHGDSRHHAARGDEPGDAGPIEPAAGRRDRPPHGCVGGRVGRHGPGRYRRARGRARRGRRLDQPDRAMGVDGLRPDGGAPVAAPRDDAGRAPDRRRPAQRVAHDEHDGAGHPPRDSGHRHRRDRNRARRQTAVSGRGHGHRCPRHAGDRVRHRRDLGRCRPSRPGARPGTAVPRSGLCRNGSRDPAPGADARGRPAAADHDGPDPGLLVAALRLSRILRRNRHGGALRGGRRPFGDPPLRRPDGFAGAAAQCRRLGLSFTHEVLSRVPRRRSTSATPRPARVSA